MKYVDLWENKFPKTTGFLKGDLPALAGSQAGVWNAFVSVSGLTADQARAAVSANAESPLLWFKPLGLRTSGEFDPAVSGRIVLSADVAQAFEAKAADPAAQLYIRITALHEACHWAWRRLGRPDHDEAGETFEVAANVHPDPAWMTGGGMAPIAAAPGTPTAAGAAAAAAGTGGGGAATTVAARVKALQDALAANLPVAPAPDLFDGSDVAIGMPRGIRNNNAGNIRVGDNWLGLAEPARMTSFQRAESAFCVFSEPEWGLRAMARILRKYQSDLNLRTPLEIIGRWAPASDNNNVVAYANAVAGALNIAATSPVDLADESRIATLMQAMARHENGVKPPYAETQYTAALRLL